MLEPSLLVVQFFQNRFQTCDELIARTFPALIPNLAATLSNRIQVRVVNRPPQEHLPIVVIVRRAKSILKHPLHISMLEPRIVPACRPIGPHKERRDTYKYEGDHNQRATHSTILPPHALALRGGAAPSRCPTVGHPDSLEIFGVTSVESRLRGVPALARSRILDRLPDEVTNEMRHPRPCWR